MLIPDIKLSTILIILWGFIMALTASYFTIELSVYQPYVSPIKAVLIPCIVSTVIGWIMIVQILGKGR